MHPEPAPDDLMTSTDAARVLALSADMVRVLARNGKLPVAGRTIGGVRLFRRADVEQLAETRRSGGR